MNKQAFLDYLSQRLEVLEKTEREDILTEFDQHIDNKMAGGRTEEEAIADFGDPEEFVDEILEAYKVNPDYNQPQPKKNTLGRWLKNFGNGVNAIADSLFQMEKRQLITTLLKLLVLCLVLWLIKVPLNIVIDFITNAFSALPDFLYLPIRTVISVLFNLAYFLLICYSLYLFIAKIFLADKGYQTFDSSEFSGINRKQNTEKERNTENRENCDHVYETPGVNETESDKNSAKTDQTILSEIKAKGYRFRKEKQKPQKKEPKNNAFIEIIVICLKILIFLCMIPVILYAFANLIGLGISLVLMCSGLPLIGITIAALGSLLCVSVLIVFVFRLLFDSKEHKRHTQKEV